MRLLLREGADMITDTPGPRTDGASAFMAWGLPSTEGGDDLVGRAVWWVGGGASLLVWTALALLLTA
jgi:hypothetical protein